MGLALAYNLAAEGGKRIVVVDANYLAWGASGRNGGGVRQQWSTEMNIRLMQESLSICAGFAQEMGINVWMRQGGYLFLARTEATRARLEASIALQNRCDVPTRLIDMDEARQLVPELEVRDASDGDEAGFAGACFNPTDAIVFPWPFLWGYARAAQKRGVAIHTATAVSAIERRASGDFVLQTSKGPLTAARVVNAAGAWSPRGRATRRRRAARLAGAPRDPLDRAAEAVLAADGLGAGVRALLFAVAARRDRRRHHPARPARPRGAPGIAAALPAIDGDRDGRDHAASSATSRSCASGPAPTT